MVCGGSACLLRAYSSSLSYEFRGFVMTKQEEIRENAGLRDSVEEAIKMIEEGG